MRHLELKPVSMRTELFLVFMLLILVINLEEYFFILFSAVQLTVHMLIYLNLLLNLRPLPQALLQLKRQLMFLHR